MGDPPDIGFFLADLFSKTSIIVSDPAKLFLFNGINQVFVRWNLFSQQKKPVNEVLDSLPSHLCIKNIILIYLILSLLTVCVEDGRLYMYYQRLFVACYIQASEMPHIGIATESWFLVT